jgi:hypothetical protein
VLHVNIDKRKMAHLNLFCNKSLAGFDALSVVEQCIYGKLNNGEPAFPLELNWQLFKPNAEYEMKMGYAY